MRRFFAFSIIGIFLLGMIGCGKLQEDNSNSQSQNKISNELVYDWLVENGELTDGTMISYTINHMNGDVLSIAASQDKEVGISFTTMSSEGLEVTCSMPLVSESPLSFDCKIVDQTSTGTTYTCKVEKKSFTSSSSIEVGDVIGFYFDGEFFDNILSRKGKYYLEYFSRTEGETVQEEIPQKKMNVINGIDNVCSQLAQQNICDMLDMMITDLCPLWDITLSDLGYEKYSPATLVEAV